MCRSRLLVVAVALSLTCLLIGVSGAATAIDDGENAAQVETPTDENETQQENPEQVEDEEYSDETAAWLAQRLGGRLLNGTVSISNGQYEQARELLGDEYDSRLEQYVIVTGETNSERDDEAADAFRNARANQQNLTEQVRQYRTQYSEYQEARDNGNERRARILARQMERTAANVSDRSQRLLRNYERIENTTAVNVTSGQTQLNETTGNITALQRTVREETLVGTTLTVDARPVTASFGDPTTISGTILTENESVPTTEAIQLRIGNQARTVDIASDGTFETQYRPRSAKLGRQSIQVEYVPAPESVYLTDSANVTVDIEQTKPTITLTREPTVVSYGDRLNVSASVSADGIAVAGVPVEIRLNERAVTRTVTSANGSLSSAVRIPAMVDNGDRSVTVRIPYQDRAIAGISNSSAIVVAQTPTTLSLDATTTNGSIVARGRLQTTEGQPVANQPVRVRVGDTGQQVVETDASGEFDVRIADLPIERGEIPVTAQYSQPDSNLMDANATATVSIQGGGGGAVPPPDAASESVLDALLSLLLGSQSDPSISIATGNTGLLWLLAGVIVLVLTGGVLVVVNRFDLLPDRQVGGSNEVAETDDGARPELVGPATPEELPETTAKDLNDRISEYLDTDEYDAAVMVAYSGVHNELTTSDDIPESVTNWELLEHCRRNGYHGERIEDVRDVVEAFELAAFSPTSIDAERAEAAVESARRLRYQ